jgi:hypothetical protein
MKNRRDLLIGLALAGVMLLAGPSWAQNQGGGGGAAGPGNQGRQLCTGGPGGTCVVNSPNTQGNQNNGSANANPKKRRGPKGPGGGGRSNQPNTQTETPAAGQ